MGDRPAPAATAAGRGRRAREQDGAHRLGGDASTRGLPATGRGGLRLPRSGLRDLRHDEGKDILIEFRWAERIDQLPEMAAELVHMDVDIIIAPASTEVEPARQATKIIPIVFTQHADPVGIGHVSESRAAWWKHHRDVDGYNRPCRQGNWKFSKMLYRMLLGLVSSGTLRRPPTQRS